MSEFEEGKNEFEKNLDDVIKMSLSFSERTLKILEEEVHDPQKLAITVYSMTKNMNAMGDSGKEMNDVAADMLVYTTRSMATRMFKWTKEEVEDFTGQYNRLADCIGEEE